jgi:hypothetical protein
MSLFIVVLGKIVDAKVSLQSEHVKCERKAFTYVCCFYVQRSPHRFDAVR